MSITLSISVPGSYSHTLQSHTAAKVPTRYSECITLRKIMHGHMIVPQHLEEDPQYRDLRSRETEPETG